MTPPAARRPAPAAERPGDPGPGGRTLRKLAELPVTTLVGVGEKKAAALAEWGVETVLDLLTTYPRRYIDRSRQADLADLAVGDQAVVLAEVRRSDVRRARRGRPRVELAVHDGTAGVTVVFFNQPWRARQLPVGSTALFFGKLDTFRGALQMVNPVVDLVIGVDGTTGDQERTGRVVPVYPASAKAGLDSWEVGRWVAEALRRAGTFADPLPAGWRDRLDLVDRTTALWHIHQPAAVADAGPARRRLAFDELFRLQLALVLRRRATERDARAIRHRVSPLQVTSDRARRPGAGPTGPERPGPARLVDEPASLVESFLSSLPFELTVAQRRALAVIFADLAGPLPMHRLLQGDVGSGKTVVAVAALLAAVQGGHQGALMVPTEVLAEQHFASVQALVDGLEVPDPSVLGGRRPLTVTLLTNRTTASERTRLRQGLADGRVDLVVGTHALLTDDVAFASLGVVVIDEQHRFGVEQRAASAGQGPGHRRRGRAGRGRRPGRRPRPAGHDGHAHPPDRGHGRLRRPRHDRPRRAAPGPQPGDHAVGPHPARGGGGLGHPPPAGGGRPAGLRGVPVGRGVRAGRGPFGRRRVRASVD